MRYTQASQILSDSGNQPHQFSGMDPDEAFPVVTYLGRCEICDEVMAARGRYSDVDRCVAGFRQEHTGHNLQEASDE